MLEGYFKKLTKLLALSALVFSFIPANGCQCPNGTYKFIKRLKKAEFVGYIEVIGYDTTKNHEFDRTFTIFKIVEQFKGKNLGQSITVLDGGDVECTQNLSYPIGTRFIIKAHLASRREHEFNFEDTPLPSTNMEIKDPILIISICSENIIRVEDNRAIGFITKNRMKLKQPQNLDIDEAIQIIEKRTLN